MKNSVILATSIIFLAVGCKNIQPTPQVNTSTNVAPSPTTQNSPTEDLGWKVCNNLQLGYLVKYPSDWHTFKPAPGEAQIDISCETEGNGSIARVFFAPDYLFKSRLIVDVIPLDETITDLDSYVASRNIKRNAVIYTTLDKISKAISFLEYDEPHLLTVHNGHVFDLIGENVSDTTFKTFTASFKFQ